MKLWENTSVNYKPIEVIIQTLVALLPVCRQRLVKDGCVTKGVAEDKRVHSWGFVCALCKLLCQEAS